VCQPDIKQTSRVHVQQDTEARSCSRRAKRMRGREHAYPPREESAAHGRLTPAPVDEPAGDSHSNARRRNLIGPKTPQPGGSACAPDERSEDGPAVTGVSIAVGVGLMCALLSALATNLAFLFKHKGAVAAPDVDMRHPLRSAIDLFRSKWWSIGWGVAAVAFALHVAALTLAPISIGQAVLAGGLVFLAVLAERYFGFELGRRQWIGIGLVAASLSLLTLTGGGEGDAQSDYSLAGMILFEGIAVCVGLILVLSHLIERIPAQRGVLLGIAAGLGFGISDVAIKALSGDLESGPVGLLSPWSVVIVTAAVFSFFASARSLQIGDGVAVIAVTSVAANLSTIIAGLAVFGDRLGSDALVIGVRGAAFALILLGAALIPAPVRAGEALEESAVEPGTPTVSPALSRTSEAEPSPQTAARQ
jgi:drug/metabolite transporter (DMT)-like permease